jgi:prepilin-type N-terminal cleavage/methylation domain-containing protein
MSINKQKGFTLIELLVVIAIIGILSSVVLASLNSARGKGSDAAAKSGLSSLQSEAAIYYDGTGAQTYAASNVSTCTTTTANLYYTDPQAKNIVANIQSNAASVSCFASTTGYTISVGLKGAVGTYWCVDSNGNATSTNPTSGAYCQ